MTARTSGGGVLVLIGGLLVAGVARAGQTTWTTNERDYDRSLLSIQTSQVTGPMASSSKGCPASLSASLI